MYSTYLRSTRQGHTYHAQLQVVGAYVWHEFWFLDGEVGRTPKRVRIIFSKCKKIRKKKSKILQVCARVFPYLFHTPRRVQKFCGIRSLQRTMFRLSLVLANEYTYEYRKARWPRFLRWTQRCYALGRVIRDDGTYLSVFKFPVPFTSSRWHYASHSNEVPYCPAPIFSSWRWRSISPPIRLYNIVYMFAARISSFYANTMVWCSIRYR